MISHYDQTQALSGNTASTTLTVAQRWQKRIAWLWPLLFFGLITAFYTFPMVFQFTTAVPGVLVEDRLQNLWNFWWIKQAISHGHNPFYTDMLFFPYYYPPFKPLPLFFHSLQLFNGLITLPLQFMGGVAAAYNGVVFLATFLSGLGTYWLVRRLGGSRAAAVVAGLIFAAAPMRVQAIEQSITNIQSTEFLPLLAFFMLAARLDEPGGGELWPRLNKKMLIGAMLSFAFCIYTDWYNVFFLVGYCIFYFGWRVLRRTTTLQSVGREVIFMLLVGAGAFVVTAPMLIPGIADFSNPNFAIELGFDREVRGSATLASLFFPGSIKLVWATCALGYTGLILSIIAIVSLFKRRQGRLSRTGWLSYSTCFYWLALSVWGCLLALGPELKLTNSLDTHLPMPYALFRLLPAVSATKVPGRFTILAMLGLAVLAAFALDWLGSLNLINRRPRLGAIVLRPRQLLTGLLLVLIFGAQILETWSPQALAAVKSNSYLEELGQQAQARNFYFLELPITRHYSKDHYRMYNQTIHGVPIMGGYISRNVIDPYRLSDSAFNRVSDLALFPHKTQPDIVPVTNDMQNLDNLVRLYNFRYVFVYVREYDNASQSQNIINLLNQHYGEQQITYRDDSLVIYHVPDNIFTAPTPLEVELGHGWYSVEHDANNHWRWTGADSRFALTTFTAEKVHVKLNAGAFLTDRTMQVQLNGQEVLQVKVSSSPTTFNFDLNLPAGRNEVRLLSLSGDGDPLKLVPGSKDDRHLAFLIHSIQFDCPNCPSN